MGSNEMEFICGDEKLEMYVDDDGMYRVYKSFLSRPLDRFYCGCISDRAFALIFFNNEVRKLTFKWEQKAQ